MGNAASDKVVSLASARAARHAVSIAKREAKKNRLDPTATAEAIAWAAYVSTWVGYDELEKLVIEFCAGVFLPPRDWPAEDWMKRSAVHTKKKRTPVANASASVLPFPPKRRA